MTARENYLIESGKALYNEKNAQVAKFVEDYEEELQKAKAKADSIIKQIDTLQRDNRILESERDTLTRYLDTIYAERCRRQKKKPEPHPDVPILLLAARMRAAAGKEEPQP